MAFIINMGLLFDSTFRFFLSQSRQGAVFLKSLRDFLGAAPGRQDLPTSTKTGSV